MTITIILFFLFKHCEAFELPDCKLPLLEMIVLLKKIAKQITINSFTLPLILII